MMNRRFRLSIICGLSAWLIACTSVLTPHDERFVKRGHISPAESTAADIPPISGSAVPLPRPREVTKTPRFTVVVKDVPIQDLLFSLVKDANLNLDIESDVDGSITINAVEQPLTSILDRVVSGTDLYYEIQNNTLRLRKDKPYLKNYRIDYLNLSRTSKGQVTVSTQIAATGAGAGAEGGGGQNNNSDTSVSNMSDNDFWGTLAGNIAAIINDGVAKTTSAESGHPDILLNKEVGLIGVRASHRHHLQISEFLSEVMASSRRQVLIEATIAEVTLNHKHQTGVDWGLIDDGAGSGVGVSQTVTDGSLFSAPNLAVSVFDDLGGGDVLSGTLRALEQFGDVKVMSSPKVMAMNNQTALLKVVDNLVYFTVDITVESGTDGSPPITYFETEVNTVPVGFVMSVTPFVSEHNTVTLNVRPTISRVIDRVRDPNPELARAEVINEIPVIQVREVESVLKVNSGHVAVIGGLMQDEEDDQTSGVPYISNIPGLGRLFKYDERRKVKTELVIFLKPLVIENDSFARQTSSFEHFAVETR